MGVFPIVSSDWTVPCDACGAFWLYISSLDPRTDDLRAPLALAENQLGMWPRSTSVLPLVRSVVPIIKFYPWVSRSRDCSLNLRRIIKFHASISSSTSAENTAAQSSKDWSQLTGPRSSTTSNTSWSLINGKLPCYTHRRRALWQRATTLAIAGWRSSNILTPPNSAFTHWKFCSCILKLPKIESSNILRTHFLLSSIVMHRVSDGY